jgi:hypothetical protein
MDWELAKGGDTLHLFGRLLGFGLLQAGQLADDAPARRRRDVLGITSIDGAGGSVVFLALVLELVRVKAAPGTLEYFHAISACLVLSAMNLRIVSGRIMTLVPTFT